MLTIIISTYSHRILRLKKVVKFKHEKIKYLIIHQTHHKVDVPYFLIREDITIIQDDSIGLTKSRNIGLKNCETNFALIADDDVEYIFEGIQNVLDIIENDRPDFATFKIKSPDKEYKNYTQDKTIIDNNLKHFISSIEILLNINKIKQNNIQFDERFGLGTKLIGGEENILIHDCINHGLKGIYYPIYIVIHPYESSGKKNYSETDRYFKLGASCKRKNVKRSFFSFRNRNIFKMIINYLNYLRGRNYIKN